MSREQAIKGFKRWNKEAPSIEGTLNFNYPDKVYYIGQPKVIVYRSTKWTNCYDSTLKRRLSGVQVLQDYAPDTSPQPYIHKFSSWFPPSYYGSSPKDGVSPTSPPHLPDHLYYLGTLDRSDQQDPLFLNFSLVGSSSVLPVILGSLEVGHKLFVVGPGNQVGILMGGIFTITSRGLVD